MICTDGNDLNNEDKDSFTASLDGLHAHSTLGSGDGSFIRFEQSGFRIVTLFFFGLGGFWSLPRCYAGRFRLKDGSGLEQCLRGNPRYTDTWRYLLSGGWHISGVHFLAGYIGDQYD